jgi:hypothetical protein
MTRQANHIARRVRRANSFALFAARRVTGAQSLQMGFDVELLHFHASIYGVI